jgi:nitrogenase molybdenum-iron protein alpha/beta subunit
MEIDRPTAADYARADIEAANRSLTSLSDSLRKACERAELMEEKLNIVSYVEQSLYYDIGLVNSGELARELKLILEAETMEDLRKLREQ